MVEDESNLRSLYVQLLRDEGYMVDEAADGEQGLLHMNEGGYDLVLLDIMLPKYDGLQILTKLKEKPPLVPNKTVIILTALKQESVVADSVSLGVRGYFVKTDLDPEQFITEVNSYLS